MNNKGNNIKSNKSVHLQNNIRLKNKLRSVKANNTINPPVKLKKVFKTVRGKLPLKLIEPCVKIFGKYDFNEYFFNTVKLAQGLKHNYNNYTGYGIILKIKLLVYVLLFKLFDGKFLTQTKISKFVGRSQVIKKRRRKK
jgi:hypothetical protein